MEIKIMNIRENNNAGSIVKAFVDINYGGLIIKGCRIVEGKNGTFLSYPREKGKDEKYYDICYPDNVSLKTEIENLVLQEWSKNYLSKIE